MSATDECCKSKTIKTYQKHAKDVGSSEVQVALLTDRIKQISEHVEKNPMDLHTKRGMLSLVSKRKNHLAYLMKNSRDSYNSLIAKLGLRK